GEPVVIVLRDALAGMVVAAGALHADAEEELGDFLRPGLRVAETAVEAGGRVRIVAPAGSEDLARELVLGDVHGHLLANPFVVLVRPCFADEPLIAAEPVGPLERPPVGERVEVEQFVDQAMPLFSVVASDEMTNLVRSGQLAGQVECNAAD